MLTKLERAHLIIFAEAVSPCRSYLAVCTNFGDLMILRLRDALRHRVAPNDRQRIIKTRLRPYAPHGAYCLRTWQHFLVCGTQSCVEAWSWPDLIAGKASKPVWSLPLPRSKDPERTVDSPEVNSMCIVEEEGQAKLFAGCGDNSVHMFDLANSGDYVRAFNGHTDYVHALTASSGRRHHFHIASGSEDGTVRLWDVRQRSATAMVEPGTVADIGRPHVGKWITTVTADSQSEDWLICGGGPQLANWHLSALRPAAVFPYEQRAFSQHALAHEDQLITVGSDKAIRHWQYNGQSCAVVASSSSHCMQVINVAIPTTQRSTGPTARPPVEMAEEDEEEREDDGLSIHDRTNVSEYFIVCGNSNRIDVCSSLGYIIFSMDV